MTDFSRYALYYMPDPGPLADFGAAWLGWDAQAGRVTPHPDIAGLPRPLDQITATPRKYGFHGTIKPPFRLADGHSVAALRSAARALCATRPPVRMAGLRLHRLGAFLALTPEGDAGPLADLAGTMVRGLDNFRAAAPEAELARRRKAGLSPRQEALLRDWGYPYVLEEFRFHLTLTGRLAPDEAEQTAQALAPHLAAIDMAPFNITSLCLAGEDTDGRFHLIERLPLLAAPDPHLT
ncbi:DUF1045 domain-containing protein [Pseudooceanicola sediminis]|uniref:DUF1045 domain-containing protein n=1 Tax=Pseudooceanicola sediminis TaxID=2211117 RepID=A0A399IXM1_9RHOB|nr:DUF1045 domain-containing protein [Pseudooceanicola sediminis]KAA2313133.1 DUF1045 domain-containing protein [Puniceibacterium sp. HSS470]RII37781.1 DUF1045 domain-containing protein [Pseudooceanicola sediminis]|tara:strand:- start:79836 stop:80546 length:711 start_codon:yes stop_codon:yes gene_type:complete